MAKRFPGRSIPAPTTSRSRTRRSTPRDGWSISRRIRKTRPARSATSSTGRSKGSRSTTDRSRGRGRASVKAVNSKSVASSEERQCRAGLMHFRPASKAGHALEPAVGISMTHMKFIAAATLALLLVAAAPGAAHHAISAKFDDKKPMTLSGVVTLVDWRNPHAHIFINVKDPKGVLNWAVELESPIDLQGGGWNPDTLKPGDAITVQGIAARDGSRQVWGNSVVVTA